MRVPCVRKSPMIILMVIGAISLIGYGNQARAEPTLKDVQARGALLCGVSTGVPGFSAKDATGRWSGLDVDFCKAVAVVTLGDPNKVTYVPTTTSDRFPILQSGQIDLLSRNTTWTMSRDSSLGFAFAAVTFFDGQGFMVRRSAGPQKPADLKGSTVCVQTGTTTELNLADYFGVHKINHAVVTFLTVEDAMAAYSSSRCDVFTTTRPGFTRSGASCPSPMITSCCPTSSRRSRLAPLCAKASPWFNIIKWTHFAMLAAEELGVKAQNVEQMMVSPNPRNPAVTGTGRRLRQGSRPHERLGRQDHQGGR